MPERGENTKMRQYQHHLLYEKEDNTNFLNYRPINLLSHKYKLFTRILAKLLCKNESKEQARFRSDFSINDHLLVLKTLIEKCVEYNKPLVLTFVE